MVWRRRYKHQRRAAHRKAEQQPRRRYLFASRRKNAVSKNQLQQWRYRARRIEVQQRCRQLAVPVVRSKRDSVIAGSSPKISESIRFRGPCRAYFAWPEWSAFVAVAAAVAS